MLLADTPRIYKASPETAKLSQDSSGSEPINVRTLDAIHVATAEVLAAEGDGEPLEFWTHDARKAAALSRGLTVRGTAIGES